MISKHVTEETKVKFLSRYRLSGVGRIIMSLFLRICYQIIVSKHLVFVEKNAVIVKIVFSILALEDLLKKVVCHWGRIKVDHLLNIFVQDKVITYIVHLEHRALKLLHWFFISSLKSFCGSENIVLFLSPDGRMIQQAHLSLECLQRETLLLRGVAVTESYF